MIPVTAITTIPTSAVTTAAPAFVLQTAIAVGGFVIGFFRDAAKDAVGKAYVS